MTLLDSGLTAVHLFHSEIINSSAGQQRRRCAVNWVAISQRVKVLHPGHFAITVDPIIGHFTALCEDRDGMEVGGYKVHSCHGHILLMSWRLKLEVHLLPTSQ